MGMIGKMSDTAQRSAQYIAQHKGTVTDAGIVGGSSIGSAIADDWLSWLLAAIAVAVGLGRLYLIYLEAKIKKEQLRHELED